MQVGNNGEENNLPTDSRIIQKGNTTHRQKLMQHSGTIHWTVWAADSRWFCWRWQKKQKAKRKEKCIKGNKHFWALL